MGGVKSLLEVYESDYIVQRLVKQHSALAAFNPTSLNTCRIYTYRPVCSHDYVVLGSAIRFGGEGAFRDNACAGGGFCKVHDDGLIDDRIFQFRNWNGRSLFQEKGIERLFFPSYQKVIDVCISMHRKLPYIDLVGWDIAVDEDGEPVLIELNQVPDCEFIQIFNGPMFGDYTDDLMQAIACSETRFHEVAKRVFPAISRHHDYNFEIGKKYSL